MTTCIDVIRHGEPVGGRRYRGHSIDDPLTEKGWQQMRAAVPDNPPWEHIISSPLQRCLAFTEELAKDLQIGFSIEENIREIGFGDWEGKTPDEIIAGDPQALERFYQDPIHNRPAGAEPLDSFSQRVWQAYLDAAEQYKNRHVLMVAHAGVARAITANILHMPLADVYSRLRIEYGGMVHSSLEPGSSPKLVIKA